MVGGKFIEDGQLRINNPSAHTKLAGQGPISVLL